MNNAPIYHTGIRADGHTAVFEYRRDVDFLSCELLRYTGRRQTTKKAARERAKANKEKVLEALNKEFPGRNFTRLVID
jgi:hypothetical protein